MRIDDVAGNGPGRHCSPCHRMPFESGFNMRVDDVAGHVRPAPPTSSQNMVTMRSSVYGLADVACHVIG